MTTEYEFFIYNPNGKNDNCYEGPYQTKDQATSSAVLNGWYEQSNEDGYIDIEVCEGNFMSIEDMTIDGKEYLENLIGGMWEIDTEGMSREAIDNLTKELTSTFQTWMYYHDVRFACLNDTKNSEVITIPKPDHVRKLEEE
jgi:hypothetical protein